MRPLHLFYAVLIPFIWGGNFVASKYAMVDFPPFLFTALRFAATAAMLLPFVARPALSDLKRIALLSTCFGVLHFALIVAALYYGLTIAACTLVAQMGVPFSCILGAVFLKDTLGWRRSFGLALAFCGVFIVMRTPNVLENLLGFTIALSGGFFWAIGNLLTKKLHGVPVFEMLGWMALLAVPQLLLLSALFEPHLWKPLADTSLRAWVSVLYTAVGSTIVAYGLWYFLLKQYPISQVAPFSLLAPVSSILFGQLFFHEPMSWHIIVGGMVTVGGVAVIVLRKPRIVEIGKTE